MTIDFECKWSNGVFCPVKVTVENGQVTKITWTDGKKLKKADFEEAKKAFENAQVAELADAPA